MDDGKVDVMPGVPATLDEVRQCFANISGESMQLFVRLVESLRDQCHINASRPVGCKYTVRASTKMSPKEVRMIPYDVHIAMRADNLAMENAYDKVLNLKDVLRDVLDEHEKKA